MEHKIGNFQNVYTTSQSSAIKSEFKRFKGQCYLDHAGSTLYSERQLSEVFKDLQNNCYGNPHTKSTPSSLTEDVIDQARYEILQHFNTAPEDYSVIFTSGATAALKLIAESFLYNNGEGENGVFSFLDDNHTSVLGMREYAENIMPISKTEVFEVSSSKHSSLDNHYTCNSLFVFPAESNFSGFKYPLAWIEMVQRGNLNSKVESRKRSRWYCMVDASAFVPTNHLDLTKYQPDFVCLSFHKMFGYPTGLGALLIKNSSAEVLERKYFGGGTVSMVLSRDKVHIPRKVLHERFEDGTLPFLSIVAVRHGFKTLKRLNLDMEMISSHTFHLAKYVFESLLLLHHCNGRPVAVLYHDSLFETRDRQGGIVNFNLLKHSGEFVGYAEVQHIANLYGIHFRTGCSCNPGACQRFLQLKAEDIKHHFELGHVCGDQYDLIEGVPTGSVRISFGYMSTKEVADAFLKMIVDCFVSKPLVNKLPSNWENIKRVVSNGYFHQKDSNNKLHGKENKKKFTIEIGHTQKPNVPLEVNCESNVVTNNMGTPFKRKHNFNNTNNFLNKTCDLIDNGNVVEGSLQQMFIYPIKSCGAFSINNSWELVMTGLKYDRQWMIVNASGVALTQKRESKLCVLKPTLNIDGNTMDLEFEGNYFKSLPLEMTTRIKISASKCLSKVCGDKVEGWDCGDEVADWLSEVFNISGLRLIKHCTEDENSAIRTSKDASKSAISLSNQAQFLLINESSISHLLDKMHQGSFKESSKDFIARFRPNLVVNFEKPFVENSLAEVQIGNVNFKFVGQCNRCQMICIDQLSGGKSPEPLRVLAEEFGGKIKFGIYLSQVEGSEYKSLEINDPISGFTAQNV